MYLKIPVLLLFLLGKNAQAADLALPAAESSIAGFVEGRARDQEGNADSSGTTLNTSDIFWFW